MKKNILLIALITVLFASCTTTKPLKVKDLESNIFTVTKIVLKSSTITPTDEELVQMFQLFPYAQICDYVYEKDGIEIDTSLIDNEYFYSNIEYNILCDAETEEELEELTEWEVNFEYDEETEQFCEIVFRMDPPDGYLTAEIIMHTTQIIPSEKEGKEDKIVNLQKKTFMTFDTWTFKNIFVDPRSCALIKFHKNIKPTFIENELFSVYQMLNKDEEGYITLNIKKPVEIRCNIDDPGNIFSSPVQIYNARFVETFQPGKKYLLKYKLIRRSPDQSKWVVVFTTKEIKPKLTK